MTLIRWVKACQNMEIIPFKRALFCFPRTDGFVAKPYISAVVKVIDRGRSREVFFDDQRNFHNI